MYRKLFVSTKFCPTISMRVHKLLEDDKKVDTIWYKYSSGSFHITFWYASSTFC